MVRHPCKGTLKGDPSVEDHRHEGAGCDCQVEASSFRAVLAAVSATGLRA